MVRNRKLAVVSGKYGGFRAMLPMLRLFDADPAWDMTVYLCDQHLWSSHGLTATEARTLLKEVHFLAPRANRRAFEGERATTLMRSFVELARIWSGCAYRPDAVIVYGDRLDALLGAALAHEEGIPVAHLQAGDQTGGTDDTRRWAISSLSRWLFCSSSYAYARCVDHWHAGQTAHIVGDHHTDAVLDPQAKWDDTIAATMPKPYYVVHMHPDTLASKEENTRVCTKMWETAAKLASGSAHFAVLPPCNDRMWEIVDACVPTSPNIHRFKHLPLEQYVPLLRGSQSLMGNSSAIYIDAPALGIAGFVYGNRQRGRDRGPFGDGTAGKQTYELLCRAIRYA